MRSEVECLVRALVGSEIKRLVLYQPPIQLLATSLVAVPPHLTSDRSPAGLANMVNQDFLGGQCGASGQPACFDPNGISPQAMAIMQQKAADGSFFVPNAATGSQLSNLQNQLADAAVQGGSSVFRADQLTCERPT